MEHSLLRGDMSSLLDYGQFWNISLPRTRKVGAHEEWYLFVGIGPPSYNKSFCPSSEIYTIV